MPHIAAQSLHKTTPPLYSTTCAPHTAHHSLTNSHNTASLHCCLRPTPYSWPTFCALNQNILQIILFNILKVDLDLHLTPEHLFLLKICILQFYRFSSFFLLLWNKLNLPYQSCFQLYLGQGPGQPDLKDSVHPRKEVLHQHGVRGVPWDELGLYSSLLR